MKQLLIPAMILPLAFLVSCQEEIQTELNQGAPAKHTVTIRARIGEETKTIFSLDGGGKYHTAWEKDDVIAIREHVTGVSTDPSLDEIDDYSSWVTSDALAADAEEATFTASFDPYYWESTLTAEQKATYTFTYTYLACTMPFYSIYTQWDGKGEYIPLSVPLSQTVYASGFATEDDLLVSKTTAPSSTRPSEIAFNFARLGTIVEITLTGLQEGDVVESGSWYTGDTFIPGLDMEHCIAYYPDLQEYIKMDGFSESFVQERKVDFTADATRQIVADSEGKATIYLRCLPGQIDDWFGLICNVSRGSETISFSKEVSLETLGRSLAFKDGGLTKFSVAMKPAQALNPDAVMYKVPMPREGFLAYWQAGAHVSGYNCYYQRREGYDYDAGEDIYYDKVNLTPLQGTGELEGLYYVEVPGGLEKDEYTLYVKAIPDAESGPASFDYFGKKLYINIPIEFTWPDVSSYSAQPELYKISDELWRVTEIGETFNPWYFDVDNVNTDWGQIWSKDQATPWTLQTKTDATFQHQGQINNIYIKLSNTTANTIKVYGLAPDGTATEIEKPESQYWSSSEVYYDYDFSGGTYNGLRIESGSYLWVQMLRIFYYAPTGD